MGLHKFLFTKLVRDKIIEISEAEGAMVDYRILNKVEHIQSLKHKLIEEVQEVLEAKELQELKQEICDVQEVLVVLKALLDISDDELTEMQRQKSEAKGSFKRGIYINSVQTPKDSRIYRYCIAAKDRYPEVIDK